MTSLRHLLGSATATGALFVVFTATSIPMTAHAGVYKCVGTDGGTTYSQLPCPTTATSSNVSTGVARSQSSQDCRLAHGFAYKTASAMRRGGTSERAYNQYGGINSLPPTTVSIISYVYTFHSSKGVSADRIASLSNARCEAGSFGDTSCASFPQRYIAGLGGCDLATQNAMGTGNSPAAAIPGNDAAFGQGPSVQHNTQRATQAAASRKQACMTRIVADLQSVEQRMRGSGSAAQHDAMNEERRRLRKALSNCG